MSRVKEVSAQVENAPTRDYRKVKRYYIIRGKICNTGVVMLLICCFLAFLCVFRPEYMPVFVISLIMFLMTVVQAYYVEVVERHE